MQATMTQTQVIQTECPTCGKASRFEFIGQQKWPDAVAKRLNIPTIVNLYDCQQCHTTLTDIQLKKNR